MRNRTTKSARFGRTVLSAALLLCAGCRSTPTDTPLDERVSALEDVTVPAGLRGSPSPASSPRPASPENNAAAEAAWNHTLPIVLDPGTRITVRVVVDETVEIEVLDRAISRQGDIFLPMLGQMEVQGITRDMLARRLTDLYVRYFVKPVVSVEITGLPEAEEVDPSSDAFVMVSGRVKKPGLVFIPAARVLRVSEAIMRVGGLDTSARSTAVRLSRRNADGTFETKTVNVRDIVTGRGGEDPFLQPGDIIYVPETVF